MSFPAVATAAPLALLDAVVLDLETRAADYEQRAADCRAIIGTLRRIYAVAPRPAAVADAPVDRSPMAPAPPTAIEPEPRAIASPRSVRKELPIGDGAAALRQRMVLDALAQATGPVRVSFVATRVSGNVSYMRVRAILKRLADAGAVITSGTGAGTMYRLARVADAVSASAPSASATDATASLAQESAVVVPSPVIVPDTPPAPPQARRGQIAAFLLRDVFTSDAPKHVADIGMALHDRFGGIAYGELTAILGELVDEGALEAFRKGGEQHYRKLAAPVRSHAAVQPETTQLLEAIGKTLSPGASVTVADLLRDCRLTNPQLTPEQLIPVLDRLARERRVDVLSVGMTKRYRKSSTWGKTA